MLATSKENKQISDTIKILLNGQMYEIPNKETFEKIAALAIQNQQLDREIAEFNKRKSEMELKVVHKESLTPCSVAKLKEPFVEDLFNLHKYELQLQRHEDNLRRIQLERALALENQKKQDEAEKLEMQKLLQELAQVFLN